MNNIDDEKREDIAAEDADELDEEDEELGEDEEIDADGVLDEDENFDDDATNELATVEEELSQKEKLARVLCMVICDEDGIRLFDVENPADLKIVKAIPNEIQVPLINKVSELFFPDKKKVLKAQIALSIFVAAEASAWGLDGHRAVCELAFQHLNNVVAIPPI